MTWLEIIVLVAAVVLVYQLHAISQTLGSIQVRAERIDHILVNISQTIPDLERSEEDAPMMELKLNDLILLAAASLFDHSTSNENEEAKQAVRKAKVLWQSVAPRGD